MNSMKPILALPRPTRRIFIAGGLSALGSGLTGPFMLIYLNQVHHYSMALSGVVLAAGPLVSLIGNPLSGVLVDRFGLRPTLVSGLLLAAAGSLGLAWIRQPWHAIAASVMVGFGVAISWPAENVLLANAVESSLRSTMFSVQYALLNIGLGGGALLASVAVTRSTPRTFALFYALDGLTFAAAAAIQWSSTGQHGLASRSRSDVPPQKTSRGYRAVLQDRTFVRLWIITFLLAALGFAQLRAALPGYAAQRGVGPQFVSLAFLANTVVVALVQLPILKLLAGRRRTRALQVLCAIWAATWLLVWTSGMSQGWLVGATFVAGAALFGCGEVLLAPSVPPLANDLAPIESQGRYNGAIALAFTAGFAVGPLIAGVMLDSGWSTGLFGVMIGGCLVAFLLVRGLGTRLSAEIDRIPPSVSENDIVQPGVSGRSAQHTCDNVMPDDA